MIDDVVSLMMAVVVGGGDDAMMMMMTWSVATAFDASCPRLRCDVSRSLRLRSARLFMYLRSKDG